MKVLVACEFSGTVRRAFRERGHEAYSCDILPSDDNSPYHFHCPVENVLEQDWDLLIAHPPCTYLTNAGVCHLRKDANRWGKLREAAFFFKMFLYSPIPRVAVENPIMHKYAKELIGQNQTQVIHPWQFGHLEQKATCLWLKGLPLLQPTANVKIEMMKLPVNQRQRLHYTPAGPNRWRIRSKTFHGIASAMADQWGLA